jgi:hypothetical protein
MAPKSKAGEQEGEWGSVALDQAGSRIRQATTHTAAKTAWRVGGRTKRAPIVTLLAPRSRISCCDSFTLRIHWQVCS